MAAGSRPRPPSASAMQVRDAGCRVLPLDAGARKVVVGPVPRRGQQRGGPVGGKPRFAGERWRRRGEQELDGVGMASPDSAVCRGNGAGLVSTAAASWPRCLDR